MDTLTGAAGGLFESVETESDKALKKQKEVYAKLTKENEEYYKKNKQYKYTEAYIAEEAMRQAGGGSAFGGITEMANGLQSQIDYMTKYNEYIEKAKQLGLNSELLAQLSDGSTASFDYLRTIATYGTSSNVRDINDKYTTLQDERNKLAEGLTANKLTVDQTYAELQAKANAALAELEAMTVPAGQAAGDTVQSIADALEAGLPNVQTGVDAIISQLDRLKSFGSIGLTVGGGTGQYLQFVAPFETGLDRVPFDGFLAQLHEGEGILTSEENRLWQAFKNGYTGNMNTMDYDTLGNVMRDNVHAGGNVYLDGRTVGQVISRQQAQSFRSLQRSGWQE